MFDNSCHFEPTFTLNGIPTLSDRCQASVILVEGRSYVCGHPPGIR